jgi:Zn finger protein HypA/HybF involved in hydrogenase expression
MEKNEGICKGCGDVVPTEDLDVDGYCGDCHKERAEDTDYYGHP